MSINRRDLLKLGGIAIATASVPRRVHAQLAPLPRAGRRRVFRAAHLTDIHIQPERAGGDGLAFTLDQIHALDDKPDLLLNTGDSIMDSWAADEQRTAVQWDLWKRVLDAHTNLPIVHAIGNHDVYWGRRDGREIPGPAGKGWALDALGIDAPYYRVDRPPWVILSLDSITRRGGGYVGLLDPPQRDWLTRELAGIPAGRFVLVLSHLPIISACGFFDGNRYQNGQWTIPGSWMHEDAGGLKDLFAKHPAVRLCLSGHMHQVDRIDFQSVSYVCGGAVSGNWWGAGRYYQCAPGYGLLDCFDDGSFDYRYVESGWVARP